MTNLNIIISRTAPRCPSCGRICDPASTWKGANYCRGLALLRFIEANPGLSRWELSKISGMSYNDTVRGLTKLREHNVVITQSEERAQGGTRYRYWPAGRTPERTRFIKMVRRVEELNDA
jgi:hypothetical protein